MQQYGMGGMGGGAPQQPVVEEPKHGEVFHVKSAASLQHVIEKYPAVVIDFWSPRCPPCMNFKPIYENIAKINPNPKIVFCAVQTMENQDIARAYQVSSIPQFNFILKGQTLTKFVGADQ